jgi:hypothetical protein
MLDLAAGLALTAHDGEVGDPFRSAERFEGAGVKLGRDDAAERMLSKDQGHDVDDP